ncbi:TRAP transporter small permease [Arhodomonas aquaeolei]|uniref:TRAP transporter small permease n=1 Tax=Arhodomonas aquaeolei TaxID=2369 RepID=UPI0003670979|nr:TRAP transporter small permease [Arhodomonas aquaeolei]
MSIIRLLNRLEEDIIALLLVVLTLLVFVETVMRFGFGATIDWAEEGSLTLAGWFVLFGASHGIKEGTHIGVDLFTRALPGRARRAVAVVAVVACLGYAGLFLYGSWVYLDKMWMLGLPMEDLPMPTWAAHSVMLIGFGLIALRLVILLVNIVRGRADGFPFANEADETMEHFEATHADEGGRS